jgi:hypothetical protein
MLDSLPGRCAMVGLVVFVTFCAIGSALLLWALVQIEHDLKRQARFNRRGKKDVTKTGTIYPNTSDPDGLLASRKNHA